MCSRVTVESRRQETTFRSWPIISEQWPIVLSIVSQKLSVAVSFKVVSYMRDPTVQLRMSRQQFFIIKTHFCCFTENVTLRDRS